MIYPGFRHDVVNFCCTGPGSHPKIFFPREPLSTGHLH